MRLLGMTLEIRLVTSAPNYLFESGDKPSLPLFQVPLIEATAHSIEGYGRLVEDPAACEIEIVRWPAQGWRPVDEGTGDEGGTVEGVFACHWRGDQLMARNDAVGCDAVR